MMEHGQESSGNQRWIWMLVNIEKCFIRLEPQGCMIKEYQCQFFKWNDAKDIYIKKKKGNKWLVIRFHPGTNKRRRNLLYISDLYKVKLDQLLLIMENWILESSAREEMSNEGFPGLLP